MRESAVMISSTMPSAKYSCVGSPLRLRNGKTTSEGLSGTRKLRPEAGSKNFTFFNGQTGTDTITITGVPDGSTLSAGTNNGGGSWTLTPAQLSGLQLDAGFATNTADLTVTATNPAGQMA